MTNLMHECPEVPLEPPAARPATSEQAATDLMTSLLRMLSAARAAGWPRDARQAEAVIQAQDAVRRCSPYIFPVVEI